MENKMTNQERLKEYLVGEKGYLKNDISNGKVVMLSGKWGSGKTHFWKNIIEKDLIEFQTKKQKAYIYTSLYGNTSINKIEDNIYAQAYLCSIGGENIVLKGYEKVKDFGKRFGSFCSLLDVSKLIDGVDEIQKNNIKNSALLYLEKGGIVCFDDFERKSKDIDLNDLFGFITQLTQNFNCKVVIILNDDVFEGEEKKIFSNVKEKTVSKFLKYEPSIKELFETIYEKHNLYNTNKELGETILNFIKESDILNARIYIQVLDNIEEWMSQIKLADLNILRCLILVNINFVLYHTIFSREAKRNNKSIEPFNLHTISALSIYGFNYISNNSFGINIMDESLTFDQYLNRLKQKNFEYKDKKDEEIKVKIQFIKDNITLFKSDYFANKLDISKNVDDETFQKINNFIETGILINE